MRQLILISFVFLTVPFRATAQNNQDWCGTNMEELSGNNRTPTGPCYGPAGLCGTAGMNAFIPDSTTPMKYFFVSIAVVDSGTYGVTQADVDSMVARCNYKYWNPWRIAVCHSTVFIDTSQMYLYAQNTDSIYYVVIYDWPNQGSAGANIRIDYSVVANNDYRGGYTLSHELGHFFGFRHVFEYTTAPTNHPSLGCQYGCRDRVEYALSAQDTLGDFIPDTPPTPLNYVCAPAPGVDSCSAGMPAWPNWGWANVMAYNICPNAVFTPQQAGRAHCVINFYAANFVARLVYGMQHCSLVTSTSDLPGNEKIDLKIMPNPFSSSTTLQAKYFFKNGTLLLSNYLGQTVKQIKNISGYTFTLQRDNLPVGLYSVRLIQDDKLISTGKIIVSD